MDYQRLVNTQTPTLGLLIQTALHHGSDRTCVVQRKLDGSQRTLFMVLIGKRALQQVRPFLLQHFALLPQPVTAIGKQMDMHPGVALSAVLTWMNQHGLLYARMALDVNGHPGEFIILTGPSVTDDFAVRLTLAGLECKLH